MSEKPAGMCPLPVALSAGGGSWGAGLVNKAAIPLETRGSSPVVKEGTQPVALTSVSPDNFSSSSWLSWRSISRTVYSPFFS